MLSVMSKNKETWKTDMIKTLRITSIVAVVLAVVFFVLPAVFGVRGDEQIEQFLNSAGVIEKFHEAKGDKVEDRRHEISPLVKQAEAFALYLNPPPKPKPKIEPSMLRSRPRPKGPVSPKFELIGTSCYALHPELSLALIDEPGKGSHWVRQFGRVGHLIIEQIKDGLVVVRDGERTFELVAERPKKRSLLKGDSSSGAHITGSKFPEIGAEIQVSAEEKAALAREAEAKREKALAELDALLVELGLEYEEADSGSRDKEITAARERIIPDRENMRISAEEARRLGRLGRRLNGVPREPNRIEDDRAESNSGLVGPNSSGLNGNEPGLNDVNIPG